MDESIHGLNPGDVVRVSIPWGKRVRALLEFGRWRQPPGFGVVEALVENADAVTITDYDNNRWDICLEHVTKIG